jgi:streptomycin 6-kinase
VSPVSVPASLDWWHTEPGGTDWLERLPRLAAECAEHWSLRLGPPFRGGNVSLTLAAQLEDGTPAVLKINFPEPESDQEAAALEHWDGEGAVRLLMRDDERRALLVERCLPGTQLWSVPDDEEATRIAAGVLRRLWRPPPREHSFVPLAAHAERWAVEIERDWEALGRPFERRVMEEAVSALRELGPDQGEAVVLHQDFHGGNVLRATREPWIAIDPKPLIGEREFDAASLVRDRRWRLNDPGAGRIVRRRLDLLASELGLDRERMRRWAVAHALAWGISGDGKLEHDLVRCAELLTEAS